MKPRLLFRTDWTTPHAAVWKDLLAEFVLRPDVSYLEVGVFEGRTLLWMFEHILTHPTATAVGVDRRVGKTLRRNLEAAALDGRVRLIEQTSAAALKRLLPQSYDLIYVDGSHLAKSVISDAVLSWELLKPNGILIFDDYSFGEDQNVPCDLKPKPALDFFVSAYGNELEILHRDYQCILRKRQMPPYSEFTDHCSAFGDFFYSWNLYGEHHREEALPGGLFGWRNGKPHFLPLDAEQEKAIRERLLEKQIGMPVAVDSETLRATPLYHSVREVWERLGVSS